MDEMLELATLGAQVLNNRSVEMAKKYNVKLEQLTMKKKQHFRFYVVQLIGTQKVFIVITKMKQITIILCLNKEKYNNV